MITSTLSTAAGYQPVYGLPSQEQFSQPSLASASASSDDNVQLSTTAQATAMQQQGLSVSQIAASMDLTTAEIDSYLDITTTTSGGAGGGGGGAPAGGGHAVGHAAPQTPSPAPVSAAAAAKTQPTASRAASDRKSVV